MVLMSNLEITPELHVTGTPCYAGAVEPVERPDYSAIGRWRVAHRKRALITCVVCGKQVEKRATAEVCSMACSQKRKRQRAKQRQQPPPAEAAGEEAAGGA
jgi:hypothetical protein